MNRLPKALLLLTLGAPLSALAQTSSGTAARNPDVTAPGVETGPTSTGQATTAPRNPGGITAGTSSGDQGRMNSPVGQIDNNGRSPRREWYATPSWRPAGPGGRASTPH